MLALPVLVLADGVKSLANPLLSLLSPLRGVRRLRGFWSKHLVGSVTRKHRVHFTKATSDGSNNSPTIREQIGLFLFARLCGRGGLVQGAREVIEYPCPCVALMANKTKCNGERRGRSIGSDPNDIAQQRR